MCRRIAATVLLTIIVIEGAVLVPSARNYEGELIARLEEAGVAALSAAFRHYDHGHPPDALILGEALTGRSAVRGGALFRPDGALIGSFGEVPQLRPGIATARDLRTTRIDNDSRYEVVWTAADSGLPFTVVARLDASRIAPKMSAFVWRVLGLVLLISVMVCAVIMVVIGRFVLVPVLQLRDGLIAARDDPANADSYALPQGHDNELGELIGAVNGLLGRVARTYREDLAILATTANQASDGILAYDGEGRMVYVNRACLGLCGVDDVAQLQAAGLPRFLVGDRTDSLTILELLASGTSGREVTLVGRHGRLVACLINAGVLTDGVGRPVRYFASIVDITELRATQQQLEQQNMELAAANRAKSSFLANMSHELRTPLNAIIGFSDIMTHQRMGPLASPQYREYAADIHASGCHLLDIIDDILDLAKISAGTTEMAETAVDVATTLAATERIIRARAAAKNIDLRFDASADLPPLHADERALKQVFVNLLDNAVKFTPADGRVAVGARLDADGALVVSIADTGVGIAAEDLPKVVQPFMQADNSLSRKHGGTGLGLPLAEWLVERHGGRLSIDSRAGFGTRVTVRFPPERVIATTDDAAIEAQMGGQSDGRAEQPIRLRIGVR
jgi:PAS domain S-box-containing protein